MVMAALAVCPCPPAAAPDRGDPHSCCAGKSGLTVSAESGGCCADESRDTVAVASAPAPAGVGGAAGVVYAMAPLPAPSLAAASTPPRSAPLVLRI